MALRVDAFERIGGQRGLCPGGMYFDSVGRQTYYVKEARDWQHAANEVLAGRLYAAAGMAAPDIVLADLGSGRPAVASRYVSDLANVYRWPGPVPGFAVDAWLANWDVGSMGNLMSTPAGELVRIDVGGALLYRAQGELKGPRFGPVVGEVDSLRDPRVNVRSAVLFAGMTTTSIAEDVRATVAKVTDDDLADAMHGLPFDAGVVTWLTETLVARRDDLLALVRRVHSNADNHCDVMIP